MKVVAIEKTSGTLDSILRMARKEPLVLTRKGKPLAAVVDVGHEDLETLALRTNPEFLAVLKGCRERHQREGGTWLEDLRVHYGLPPRARRNRSGR